jgi:hypothetical protein
MVRNRARVMATTKLAVLGFLTGCGSGWRSLSLGCALLCACSVYDAQLLPSRSDGLKEVDGGTGGPVADGGERDAAVVECASDELARCERSHAEANCVEGTCVIQRCLDGYVDCDANSENGCEAKLDTAQNCGLCGAACRYNRASASCTAGLCALAKCNPGYANCDGDDDNGCETDLNTLSNCGECGKTCGASDNANPGCKDLKCGVGTCIGPFGDCDSDAANGCEQQLNTAAHCGKCDGKCDPAHGDGTCDSGSCVVTKCDPGFADCNGVAADGCETALDSADHCGACGTSCKLPHVTHPSCEAVDGGGFRCVVTHACDPESAPCTVGALENGCEEGYSDCDKDTANGCEADLARSTNCGTCGTSCVKVNTVSECREGKCADTGCGPGAATCGGNQCKLLATDPQNCGACGTICSGNATLCAGGKCTPQICTNNRADCDGDQGNGCEVDLTANDNCGVCGQRCPNRSHTTGVCRGGTCGIGTCEAGWKDCDGDPNNGCEVNIRTLNDCGDCQKACVAPNAQTACNNNGQCSISQCTDGRGNCNTNLADGCEADFSLPTTCGGCNNVCASLMDVLSSSCEGGKCSLVCGTGRADCDGMPGNGCEADLTTSASCGSCMNNCTTLANVASATCTAGTCGKIMCRPGFADCNGNPADGCERSLNSLTDCGACDRACAPAHAQSQCTNGTCGLMQCDRGFADCNNRPNDGCETPLSTAQNCGSCGNSCANNGTCNNGRCGCTTDAECGFGNSCCDGTCADTSTTCFLWPCLPGTDAQSSNGNCGGCGGVCIFCCQDIAASTPPPQ